MAFTEEDTGGGAAESVRGAGDEDTGHGIILSLEACWYRSAGQRSQAASPSQSTAEISCREAGHYQPGRQARDEASPDHGDSRDRSAAEPILRGQPCMCWFRPAFAIASPRCLCNAARNAAQARSFESAVVPAGPNLARSAATRQPPGCPRPRRGGAADCRRQVVAACRLPVRRSRSVLPDLVDGQVAGVGGRGESDLRAARSGPRVSCSRCGLGRSTASGASSPRRSANRRPRPARERRLKQRASGQR
jgi:hypothetical protein